MNIKVHSLESLRKIIRRLEKENRELKHLLKSAGVNFADQNSFDPHIDRIESYDFDQGARINEKFITMNEVQSFYRMFWGRQDVYAKRGKNGGYFPQCANRWNSICPKQRGERQFCDDCAYNQWLKLTPDKIMAHLIGYKEDGSDVIGVYPLFPDGTCRFLVFDFDNHEKGSATNDYANTDDEWRDEVDALREMCRENGISPLVERSRSGRGAHLWIIFDKPIPASLARNFGFMLLDKGSSSVNMKSFHYYDRMYPSQDAASSLGNLIALPLQGQALKNGNSAFVDDNWNAYPDQWDVLINHTQRLSRENIEMLMQQWTSEAGTDNSDGEYVYTTRPKPWKRQQKFNRTDVIGSLSIVLGDGIYVDALNLMPRIQNKIRSLAAFDNPIFYKNKRLGYSNYYNFSSVYLGKDVDGYIRIPRGLYEQLVAKCEEASIPYTITDEREKGRPIRVSFNGSLRAQQELAANKMLDNDNGVLSAATAFGKTVVCSYLIASRHVNCLVIVPNRELLNQWVEELNDFLIIDEELPTYETKTGRIKQRDSVIGVIHGAKKAPTGIVDVAMVGSLHSKGEWNDLINSYGMVIFDECHHAASATAVEVLQQINAKYVYGVSATLKRSDDLEKIITMMIGPMRHSYTAKERAATQGILHVVYPRYTRVVDTVESRENINDAFGLIVNNSDRNQQIVRDVVDCVCDGRTPVILTKHKEHAKILYELLQDAADHVFLLYGDNTAKENKSLISTMKNTPRDETVILIATGQKIGEGFDYPRLDTLMLAAPVSFDGRVEQYAGRLNRDYDGKVDVRVYDYVDSHIRYFDNMYLKRLKAYKKIGYSIAHTASDDKQIANAIYDAGNYMDVFERDIIEADKSILISSPVLTHGKVDRFTSIIQSRIEVGVRVTVVTTDPDTALDANSSYYMEQINKLKTSGINVIAKADVSEHFCVIDGSLVWHGGVNLLGSEDIWDNLIRINSEPVATELIEIALGDDQWEEWSKRSMGNE